LTFGHLVPISGALKSSFPALSVQLDQLFLYREIGLLAVAALVWTAVKRRELDAGVGILAWGFFGQLLYMLLFLKWAPFAYYIVALGLPLSALALGHLFGGTLRGRIKWQRAVVVAATVAVVAGQTISWTRTDYGFQRSTYQAALWAAANTPPDAVFAMRDSGIFGYFCERSCINLDGLVNDYDYQRVISAGLLGEYLKTEGVNYFVHHALPSDIEDSYEELEFIVPGRLYGGRSTYVLRRADEVFRTEPYRYGYASTRLTLAIWKIG